MCVREGAGCETRQVCVVGCALCGAHLYVPGAGRFRVAVCTCPAHNAGITFSWSKCVLCLSISCTASFVWYHLGIIACPSGSCQSFSMSHRDIDSYTSVSRLNYAHSPFLTLFSFLGTKACVQLLVRCLRGQLRGQPLCASRLRGQLCAQIPLNFKSLHPTLKWLHPFLLLQSRILKFSSPWFSCPSTPGTLGSRIVQAQTTLVFHLWVGLFSDSLPPAMKSSISPANLRSKLTSKLFR